MNILFICEEYPPGKNGGIGTMVSTLCNELINQGHKAFVIGLYPHGYGQKNYEEKNGVKIWRLRYLSDFLFSDNGSTSSKTKFLYRCLKYSGILQLDTLYSINKMNRLIKKVIKQENIDIIECSDWNTSFQNSFIKIRYAQFTVPFIVKYNGTHSYFRKELNLSLKNHVFKSEKNLLNYATALCSVSKYTGEVTNNLFEINKPVKILYNCINLPVHKIETAPQKTIIFTGTLTLKKGILSLLKAWNEVTKIYPDVTLEIYGKGDKEPFLSVLSSEAIKTVYFKGHVSQQELTTKLAGAIAAVFPSYSECFALAPLEAMSVGCPVINTSRASGKELVIDRENGLLIDPDDIQGIAESIKLLIENNSLRTKIAENGRKTIYEKFNISHSVKEHIQFYQEVIQRKI